MPLCWVGKRRFEQGVALLGDAAPPLDIHWHPYQLEPDAGTEPVPLRDAYAAKFGSAARAEEMLARMQDTARAEGLPSGFSRGQVRVTTLPAHRLLWLAKREGDVDAVIEALSSAHLAEGRNLVDAETLVAAGAAGGLPESRVRALLAGDEGVAEVRAGIAEAQATGIRAVPSFVLEGRVLVQGAQPPEAIAAAICEAMAGTPAVDAGGDAAACGVDGCQT